MSALVERAASISVRANVGLKAVRTPRELPQSAHRSLASKRWHASSALCGHCADAVVEGYTRSVKHVSEAGSERTAQRCPAALALLRCGMLHERYMLGLLVYSRYISPVMLSALKMLPFYLVGPGSRHL